MVEQTIARDAERSATGWLGDGVMIWARTDLACPTIEHDDAGFIVDPSVPRGELTLEVQPTDASGG